MNVRTWQNDFVPAALQLEPDGTYITRSLSLSPIIWAMGA